MKGWKKAIGAAAASLVLVQLSVESASAWGALAIGTSGDIQKDGFAIGSAYGRPSEDDAKAAALKSCQNFQNAPKRTTALCSVIMSFHGQCYAFAEDPKAGTPGVGWGIGAGGPAAVQKALAMCKATAGPNRAQFCESRINACDTHD